MSASESDKKNEEPAIKPAPSFSNTDPVLALIYGPSGGGKTADCGLSFPNALFVAQPGALQSIRAVAHYNPKMVHANYITEITSLILAVGERKEKGDTTIDALVVDDFSYVAEQTFALHERSKLTGYKLWGALRDDVIEFRNAARFAKMHIITSCWEQAPKDKPNGARVKGGPMLSGNLPEQVPAMFDLVLRCGLDQLQKPWPGTYQCVADANYTMKDRLHIASRCHPAPMNLGEIMRAAGYSVSRLAELPWQEAVVEKLAQKFVTEGAARDKELANNAYNDLIKNGIHPAHAAWTLRDALARTIIRRAAAQRQSSFFQ